MNNKAARFFVLGQRPGDVDIQAMLNVIGCFLLIEHLTVL